MICGELLNKYNKISTPEELLEFMSKYISYGYLGRNNRVYHFDDVDFDRDWYSFYILEKRRDILKTCFGNCFDQTELERDWFLKHNYEIKTIYVMLDFNDVNDSPSHSFLIYKDKVDGSWNWFENADFDNRGIHKFSCLEDLLEYQLNKYLVFLKDNGIDVDLGNVVRKEFLEPKDNCSASEYLDFVISFGVDI